MSKFIKFGGERISKDSFETFAEFVNFLYKVGVYEGYFNTDISHFCRLYGETPNNCDGFMSALGMVGFINRLGLEMYSNNLHPFNDKFGK